MKQVDDYPDYSITRDGRIYSNKFGNGKYLKLGLNKKGYHQIKLYKNNKPIMCRVNRLVALTYISNPKYLLEVNHINGVKTDNRVENLEWVTHLENMQHAWKTGLFDNRNLGGENCHKAKLTQIQVDEIRKNHI